MPTQHSQMEVPRADGAYLDRRLRRGQNIPVKTDNSFEVKYNAECMICG